MDKIITMIVIALTFIFFALALMIKGFNTHDILLEVAVFLVSAKLIIANYQDNKSHKELLRELAEIKAAMPCCEKKTPPPAK